MGDDEFVFSVSKEVDKLMGFLTGRERARWREGERKKWESGGLTGGGTVMGYFSVRKNTLTKSGKKHEEKWNVNAVEKWLLR